MVMVWRRLAMVWGTSGWAVGSKVGNEFRGGFVMVNGVTEA